MKLFYLIFVISLNCYANEQLTLNLDNVDIRTVAQEVSKLTGRNFLIDNKVKGNVTLISNNAVSKDELYKIFISALSISGFATVESGKVTKIIPEDAAKKDNSPLSKTYNPDEIVTQTISAKYINASQLSSILKPLMPETSYISSSPDNNILIISDKVANIERLRQIVKRIDTPQENDVETIRLNHASAKEVANMINGLFSKESSSGNSSGFSANANMGEKSNTMPSSNSNSGGIKNANIIPDIRTNTLLISGEPVLRLRVKALIAHLDTPLEKSKGTRIIFLQNAQAKELVDILKGISESITNSKGSTGMTGSTGNQTTSTQTFIQANEATNSLIISAAPDVLPILEDTARQLDIRRAQVLVEAIIAEVEATDSEELGLQWLSSSGTNSPIFSFSSNSPLKNLNFSGLIKFLNKTKGANILSTPSIVTTDNEQAEIIVGQNVPFVTGQYNGNSNNNTGTPTPFQTIQRQDVGIKLKVKPQISEGQAIKFWLEQEVSNVVADKAGASDLVTNKRSLKTAVTVEDRGIIVLGGLIDESMTNSEQKIPFLGDIPVLGHLFRTTGGDRGKRNLLMFLHPIIIRDAETEKQISAKQYNYMRMIQQKNQNEENNMPVLPDLNNFLTDWSFTNS